MHAHASTAPWLSAGYPGHMPVPTMLSRSEIDYLYWLASTQYTGRGRIVELGCFFGGSTMPLAQALSHRAAPNLLTYDSFVMDADTAPRYPVGIEPGQSFRPVFETYLRPHLPRITIREGWLPLEYAPGDDRRIYPEQEPVEILFIDAAKHWTLHDSIIRIFGPHLIPGVSTVIQQDFKHHACYWIALHMHQLRDHFEPRHDITGGASVSFHYKGGLDPTSLARREDITDIRAAWDAIDAFWAARSDTSIRLFMRLAAATHLADARRGHEAAELLRLFTEELKHASSLLPLPEGGGWGKGSRPPHALEPRNGPGDRPVPSAPPTDLPSLRAEFIDTCRRVECAPGGQHAAQLRLAQESAAAPALAWRESRRAIVIDRCLSERLSTVALYGAGRHTAELLRSGWPHGRLRIAAILDDYSTAKDIAGIPVLKPAATPTSVQAVIVSSEASEHALWRAASDAITDRPILRIYT